MFVVLSLLLLVGYGGGGGGCGDGGGGCGYYSCLIWYSFSPHPVL